MLRSILYGSRAGLADLKRMPLVVSTTILVVALATGLALLSTMLDEGTDVASSEISAMAQVIVWLDPELNPEETDEAGATLAGLPGVHVARPATEGEVAETTTGFAVGSDLSGIRTLELDGSLTQATVVDDVRRIEGVENAEAGVGDRLELTGSLIVLVVPWFAGFLGIAGVVLIANLAYAAARGRREEAQIMRLLGATWVATWASLATVVVLPLVLTVLVTTLAVALTWPLLLGWFLPDTNWPGGGSNVVVTGLWLTLVAGLVAVVMARIGLARSER